MSMRKKASKQTSHYIFNIMSYLVVLEIEYVDESNSESRARFRFWHYRHQIHC